MFLNFYDKQNSQLESQKKIKNRTWNWKNETYENNEKKI